jgi:hypothetical protein
MIKGKIKHRFDEEREATTKQIKIATIITKRRKNAFL